MTSTILFLPRDEADEWRWLRVADDRVADRGEGLPEIPAEDSVTAVAPADAVTLHWAELPDRSAAQSVAAARILAAEASASPVADLHVAVGREDDLPDRPIAVVDNARMAGRLALLGGIGVDPVSILPAPMLLPRPDEGFVRADLGNGGAVRGAATGFADEARLTELVTPGGAVPETLGRETLEEAIVAAIAAPVLDLRQGAFARRRRRAIDWRLVRRLAVLAGAILAVTLLIDLVRIAKYSFGADTLEARADAVARTGLPRGADAGDPDRLLDERPSRLRGPGLGFSRTAALVFAAVRDAGGSEVTRIDFDANGDMRVGITTDGEAQANNVKRAIEAAGFRVDDSPFAAAGNRLSGELTVRAP